MLFQDTRDYQILFLCFFLFLGIWTRDWTLRPDLIVVAIATCLITQGLAVFILSKFKKVQTPPMALRSAGITALSLCLLLRADHYTTIVLAGSLAILSKFLFQFRRKHFFNPANFGIISALSITPDAWVSPGQWGDDWWYGLIFIGTGGIILKRVGRWDTTVTFLSSYAFLEAIRNIWLGWTWDVFSHRLMSGSLLLFSLFMITDPRSIPNAPMGRSIWAVAIAVLTFILRNQFFIPSAVFWALFALAPLIILLDIIWSAPRFSWFMAGKYLTDTTDIVSTESKPANAAQRLAKLLSICKVSNHYREVTMRLFKLLLTIILAFLVFVCLTPTAWAFCGFYIAKADTKLYNKASQVVIARDGDRTVLTMANDFQGDVKDFAIVVPVPVVLQQEQVHIGEPKIIERLDAFSAPRLVEYFDEDPCSFPEHRGREYGTSRVPAGALSKVTENERALGITIESRFTVGEYDILILSAKESDGLETWLIRNGYQIPQTAKQILQPYIRQNMKFFVAKVNLREFQNSGSQFLRPLQMAYESSKFMLPIRLGMINATDEQDLIVYVLSPQGQVEMTNYRTVKVPSGSEIPVFVKDDFGDFYKAMFQTSYIREDKKVAFLEYAWDMSSCDPCSAEPLNSEELRKAGVFWLSPQTGTRVFITRLHVRYTRNKFPEDLMFQETANHQLFQGRYVLRHPFTGDIKCEAGQAYQTSLAKRFEKESQTLAKLTGWNIQDIRKKMPMAQSQSVPFWRNIWP